MGGVGGVGMGGLLQKVAFEALMRVSPDLGRAARASGGGLLPLSGRCPAALSAAEATGRHRRQLLLALAAAVFEQVCRHRLARRHSLPFALLPLPPVSWQSANRRRCLVVTCFLPSSQVEDERLEHVSRRRGRARFR